MSKNYSIKRHSGAEIIDLTDQVIEESPLQISTSKSGIISPSSITMRTPGHDVELALGFFYNEGLINRKEDVDAWVQEEDLVILKMNASTEDKNKDIQRNFYMTSSCGVCGKSTIDELKMHAHPFQTPQRQELPDFDAMYQVMREQQVYFEATGGCHGAGIFDYNSQPVVIREDVGRHNAVDKCSGYLLLNQKLHEKEYVLCLSGRSCYELVQKAVRMRCSTVVSIGAPSSLAIETARAFNLKLIGFYKKNGYNRYA